MKFAPVMLCLALVAPIASAQQGPVWGLQGTVAFPRDGGDHLDGKIGFGFGGHALWALKGPHAIEGRADYHIYNGDNDYKFTELLVGADYQ